MATLYICIVSMYALVEGFGDDPVLPIGPVLPNPMILDPPPPPPPLSEVSPESWGIKYQCWWHHQCQNSSPDMP